MLQCTCSNHLISAKRHYLSYLGPEFTKAFEEVSFDIKISFKITPLLPSKVECFSSSPISSISSFTTTTLLLMISFAFVL